MAPRSGPARRDVVTVVVPKREEVRARVDDAGATWADLTLLTTPRTPWAQLEHQQVWVQFAGAQGLSRLIGQLGHPPFASGRPGHSAGDTLRFTHRGQVQLLFRPALVHAKANARIVVLRAGARDHVALEARCVAVSGGGLRVTGVPFAAAGQHFDFDLALLPHEAPIRGQFVVERVEAGGVLATRFSVLGAAERSRIVHWAAEHATPRVA